MSTTVKRVAKVLVTDGTKLLMALRGEDNKHRPSEWDFLGGGEEPLDTSFEDIARREVFEETKGGILIPVGALQPFHAESWDKPGKDLRIVAVYYLGNLGVLPEVVEPSKEHVAIQAFTVERAREVNQYDRQDDILGIVQAHGLIGVNTQ